MPGFLDEYERAFGAMDPDRILDLFSDDAQVRAEDMDVPLDKESMRRWVEEAARVVDSMDLDVKKTIRQGDEAAILLDVHVAFKDDYRFGDMILPTAGKTARIPAALFVTLDEEGRAQEVTRVRDNWQVMRELGIGAEEMEATRAQAERMVQERQGARRGEAGTRPA